MNSTMLVSMMAASLLMIGCDNRQKLASDSAPFSVGGIQLGAPKDSLKNPNELIGCAPETADKAKCYVSDTKIRYEIFGADAHFITVKLYAPYNNIEEINISFKGKKITKNEVEQKWDLKGKCLDRYEIDESQKFDKETSGYFIRALNEFNLLPSSGGDFVCLADNNKFFKYSQYTGKSEGGIDIYYLKDVFATNYRYLFKSQIAHQTANEEVAKAFAKPVVQTPSNRCGKKYDPDSQEHGASMDKLAAIAKYENGADRYFSAFVSELCAGTGDGAKDYVNNAQIPIETARHVAQHFGLNIQFDEPSTQSKNIEKIRQDLTG
ncbi:MAG: hypothetical protein Q8S51_16760, partial [Rhodoferax sp.]|uniref:hypothetical protein n=1 Tax=Rhodoferax sp. TaxID=50421 RepID=UPI0027338761